MPIKSLVENQSRKAEFVIGRDVELSLCSNTCLLQGLDERARVVRTGQTASTALTVILDEDRLLVPIAMAPRPDMHILGSQHSDASARANWEKLIACKHRTLMPVYRVCDCSAEIQIIDGEEFEDAATTPAWKKVRGILGKSRSADSSSHPATFDQWRSWMADLAQGLAELEKMGLAHGDPYPFNAIRNGRDATWVDFGHLTDDPDQRVKDAWAFVLFTVLHTESRSVTYSPSLLKNLATALAQADQPGRFERIRDVLRQPYDDVLLDDDVRTSSMIFVKAISAHPDTAFSNPAIPELLLKASIQYFSAFLHHIQRGNHFSSAFHAELQRHRLQEEEMLRLTVPRAEHHNQLDALRTSHQQLVAQKAEEIMQLHQLVVQKDERESNLDQAIGELRTQLEDRDRMLMQHDAKAASLDGIVGDLGRQLAQQRHITAQKDKENAGLNETLAELQAQIADLTQLAERKDAQNSRLRQAIAGLDHKVADLNLLSKQKDEQASELHHSIEGLDAQLESLHQLVASKAEENVGLQHEVATNERRANQMREELDALFRRYEQLLHSRSWRITRPLRATAGFYRYGFKYDGGRQALYRVAASIGRAFPFPLWMKARVRSALIEKPTVVTPYQSIEDAPAYLPLSAQETAGSAATNASMRAECCALIPGLVSVVLPVYNQANLIAESIDSVLAQTYHDFELIIINDGSSDNVEAVLARYLNHPKVRCFTQPNQRLPKALSNGFEHARGEFWSWTSADNIMEPQMLEKLVAKLRDDPTAGMVYADYYAIDDRSALLADTTWRAHNRPDPASAEIRLPHTTEHLNTVQDNFIGPCFMYRGWIGQCIGDYDTQLGIEDYDYWMRINAFFPIRHLGDDSLLYRYRVHDNTLSAQAHEHRILDKAQQLMAYEKERAARYAAPLTYISDEEGTAWLISRGVAASDIRALNADIPDNAVIVVNAVTAQQHLAGLLHAGLPTVILLNQAHHRYHKLRGLLNSGHCAVLANDRISADRVRMVSGCPVFDLHADITLAAVRAFARNLLVVRATRDRDAMRRSAPHYILPPHERHVLLQVDSFTQGGMENVVIDLGLSLQACGYRISIANFGASGDAAAKAEERGLKVVSLSPDLGDEGYVSWLRTHQVDLVNAHYSVRGAAAAHKAGIPFIQTIHNAYVWLDAQNIARYREADRYTTRYLCVSVTAARYAEVTLGLDVGKMQVVPNGIDPHAIAPEHFAGNRTSLRESWGVDADAPVFLNVASIMATKAQLPLVKAFARVVDKSPKARLILLGNSMEAPYFNAVKNAVRELRLQDNVVFAGYDRDVARYYHAADVFVLPSFWEGWSLSLAEAITNGLACVITDVGSAYEFEGLENVEIVEPPFGDITTLNFQNLGQFVYGEDTAFEERLAEAMLRVAQRPRDAIHLELAEQLDCAMAYRTYAEIFSKG